MSAGKKAKMTGSVSGSSSRPVEGEENQAGSSGLEESIKVELKNRMLASGEWLRLTKVVREQLKGSSWEENLRCMAEARALEPDEPGLGKLIEYIQPIAAETVPAELKDDIMSSIRQFVEVNVEADNGNT
ncbi:hypothetical protein CROQUDRAFT_54519 [Cronartium quercuum f. sp. fusiforme G11]|uniref:Transcription and mRNA export factor SUS1 n=1 Tax=Cronartium quercuum f. sp. fusiforme G11 TaxID=708437 RepID=A0A9P6T5D6_9BASI|nr:hypothetical protein CROQUDRAFT_54519 [Cronartium quercuum f. sp. fusiforme G11]